MQYRKSFVNKRGKAWPGGMMGREDKGRRKEGRRGTEEKGGGEEMRLYGEDKKMERVEDEKE